MLAIPLKTDQDFAHIHNQPSSQNFLPYITINVEKAVEAKVEKATEAEVVEAAEAKLTEEKSRGHILEVPLC